MPKTNTKAPTGVVGKDELIHQVAAKSGLMLKDALAAVDALSDVVRENLTQNKEVRLMGFGTWNKRMIAPRMVKSIRDGSSIQLSSHERVHFTPGAVLKQAAQNGKARIH